MLELENKVMEIPERERVLSLVKEGNLAELQSALTTISTIDLVDDNGITPLMAACIFRPAEPEVVSLLLESGADVEPISTHEEVITLLVRKGLNPVVTDANGWNAFRDAGQPHHVPGTGDPGDRAGGSLPARRRGGSGGRCLLPQGAPRGER